MSRLASVLCVAVLFSTSATIARAQETASSDPPAHVAFVDGTAVLERDGKTETAPTSMPLLAGDRLRTENGRIEVLFGDGSTLHVDTISTVDFQSDEVIRLIRGRVRLNITGADRSVSYRVDAPAAWVEIHQPGEYRVGLDRGAANGQVELAVLRGAAELVNEDGRTRLRAGERAFASTGAAPSYAYVYNSASWDAFDQWSEARRDQRLGVSSQYLPDTVRSYSATFDNYGAWQYDTSYGYVWYPRVAVGWRPYYYGRWSSVYPWGWTWIGADPWAWPTHHYGRWGFSAGVWFWIPGRTWGPAWVSWGYAPGYVSWCPLGWDNRAIVGINVYGGRYYNPWHAWTVVPHNRFGTGYVNVNVVATSRLDPRTRSAFVGGQAAPNYRHYAVPRGVAPIYAAGTRPVSGSVGSIRTVNPNSFGASGSAVPRDSRAAVGSRADVQSATETFRSRGRTTTSQGPGFPQSSRTPRDSAVITTRGSQAPAGAREVTPNGAPAAFDRRAVLRGGEGTDPSNGSAPARRLEVPGYTRAPSAASPSAVQPSGVQRDSTSPGGRYAVPRGSGSDAYAPRNNVSAPAGGGAVRRYDGYSPRENQQPIDRGGWRAPEVIRGTPPDGGQYGGARAVPRQSPESAPSRGYQPGPGYERRAPAPSGQPPSAGPSRSAEPSRGGGGGGGGGAPAGQSRGGQGGRGGHSRG